MITCNTSQFPNGYDEIGDAYMARVLSNLCDSAGSKRPIVAQYRIAGVPNGLYNASPGK